MDSVKVAIIILTFSGFICQWVPFFMKYRKIGNPSMSIKELKQKSYKNLCTKGEAVHEEVLTLTREFLWVLVGGFLQFLALILSLNI